MTHPSPVNVTYADGQTIHGADINAYGTAINQLGTLTNPTPVSAGGTGATTLTGLLVGNGTSAVTVVTAPTGTVVGTTDTQTLTNKTIFAATASITNSGGTTTLLVTSAPIELFTGTLSQVCALPTTGVPAGAQFWIINTSTGAVTVNASGGTTVTTVASGALTIVTALKATPVLNTDWGFLAGLTASFGTAPTANALAEWDSNKNLSSNNWLPLQQSTTTAASTTTLTIASAQVQIFTGSTTQTVLLPTTSVQAGYQYIIENQSSGAVTVQSSGANTIAVLAANAQGVFIATVNTPTTAAGWDARVSIVGKTLTANNSLTLAGTDGTTITFPATVGTPAASSIAGWDANVNLTANNTFDGFQQITTAAGTTTLLVGSPAITEFIGTAIQTCVLPTTGIPAGAQYIIINQSTAAVTVQSSNTSVIVALSGSSGGIASSAIFTCVKPTGTPVAATDWNCQHLAINIATGKILSVGNSLTLNGTDGTTVLFPVSTTNPAPAASTIAGWDANSNISANSFLPVQQSRNSSGTPFTLTLASPQVQIFTGSTVAIVTLPTTTINAGYDYTIVNQSSATLTVNASGGTTVAVLQTNQIGIFVSAINTPTTNAHWIADVYANGVALTATGSTLVLTSAGTALTFTLPAASDTLAGLAATQTFTNKTETGLKFTAGTTALAPLQLASGVNLTAPLAGAMEYDGVVPYFSPAASTRAVLTNEQFCTLTAAYTGGTGTTPQKMFNATTNGAVTLPIGTYFFECFFTLTGLSGTTGTFGWTLAAGTATIAAILWESEASPTALATPVAPTVTVNTAANAALTATSTSTIGWAKIRGKCRISVAGTVIPSISQSQAGTPVVAADSWFRIWQVGTNTVTTVGNWS